MEKFILSIILLSFAIFNHCSTGNQQKDTDLDKSDSMSETMVDTNYSPGSPQLTSIPFPQINPDTIQSECIDYIGPSSDNAHEEFFDLKSYKSKKYYKLPEIRKLKHIIVDSSLEVFSCIDNISLDSLLHFKKYQIRFTPLGKYEFYYVCDWDWGDTTAYLNSAAIQKYCREFNLYHANWYGFLIVYDPSTMEAKVVELYNSYHAGFERRFYIQSDHKIKIVEIEVKELLPNGKLRVLGRVIKNYEVSLLDNGEIKIVRANATRNSR
jgi:hypothetical protein